MTLDVTELNHIPVGERLIDGAIINALIDAANSNIMFFNVKDYGAIGDGVADDTDAINATFDALREWRTANGGRGAKIYIPDGVYSVSSINGTQIISNWFIEAWGATFLANTDDVAVLDLLGSYGCAVFGLTIRTPSGVTPRLGIQIARQQGGGALDNKLWKCDIDGTFTLAAVMNMGGEVNSYDHCHFINRTSSATAYGLILDGWNYWGPQSLYLTPTYPANTPVGMTKITMRDTTIGGGGSSAVKHPGMWVSFIRNCRFQGYLAAWDYSAIEIYSGSNAHGIQDVIFDLRCEAQIDASQGIQQIFKFIGPATAPIHTDCEFRENAFFALSSVCLADAAITPQLRRWTFRIDSLAVTSRPPANGMFYPLGQFGNISGTIIWGDTVVPLNVDGNAFTGDIRVYNRGTASYPTGTQIIYDDLTSTIAIKGEVNYYGSTTGVAEGGLSALNRLRVKADTLVFLPIAGTNPGVQMIDPATAASGATLAFNSTDQGLHLSSDVEGLWIRKGGKITLAQGYLGIGNVNPTYPLEARLTSAGAISEIATLTNASATTGTGARLKFNISTNIATNSAYIDAVRSNSPANTATYLSFVVSNGTQNVEALRLTERGGLTVQKTITAGGTTGNQTIDKPAGRVNFAAAATSLTVTNALVTANSVIMVSLATVDATAVLGAVVAGSGSFVINMSTAPTAETAVNFLVIN